MRKRFAAVLIPIVMAVCACSDTDDAATTTTFAPPLTNPPLPTLPTTDASPATSTSDTAVASTDVPDSTVSTTTIGEVTTVTSVEATPATTQPGEPDWTAIVQGLYNRLDEINADPSLDQIDDFCAEGQSPCRIDGLGTQIEALVRDSWRIINVPPTAVLRASIIDTADGLAPLESTLGILDVEIGETSAYVGQIVDADDNVLFDVTEESTEPGRASWFLRRNSDGEWRVFDIRVLD